MDLVTFLIAAAWLAILGVFFWGVVSGWRTQLLSDLPLPFFRLLEREGLTVARAGALVGVTELTDAANRCTTCASRRACDLGGFRFTRPAGCPNEQLFERLGGPKTA